MKTTLELPDTLFRRLKARAATRGQSMKVFVATALRHELDGDEGVERQSPEPAWKKFYGALKEHKAEIDHIQASIDREFGKINPDDWK